MKIRYASAFLLFAFAWLSIQAQDHRIKFNETTHNFGTLKKGAPAEFEFEFTNISEAPVKLTRVKASCGCTTPKWSREEIKPGATGTIKVKYNSNRIGPFNKSVRVEYDSLPTPLVLFIKGKVEQEATAKPEEKGSSNINYGIPRGDLAFEKMIHNVKELSSDKEAVFEFRFKNVSNRVVNLQDKLEADEEFVLEPTHKLLKPGQESSLKVVLSGKKMKDLNRANGYFSKRVAFFTDEQTNAKKQMTVNGNFKVVYSEEEKAASPKMVFEQVSVNGGQIIEGEKFVYDYKFKNEGKADLIISQAKASCGCTATKPDRDRIAPGESGYIRATFNSTGRPGKQSKSVTVRSNDVENPTTILRFSVEVVKDPFHAGSMMGGSRE